MRAWTVVASHGRGAEVFNVDIASRPKCPYDNVTKPRGGTVKMVKRLPPPSLHFQASTYLASMVAHIGHQDQSNTSPLIPGRAPG